jgi:hypothetical protein
MRGSSYDQETRQPIRGEVVKLEGHGCGNKTKTYHDNEGNCSEDKLKVNHSRHGEVRQGTSGGERRLLKQVGHGDNWARDTADRDPLFSEAHLVCPNDPADKDGSKGVKRHEGRVDGPFSLHNTCIQDNEAGYALKSDQTGGR